MGIQQKLHTKLVQKLILTPSLQQAIKLLPMSTLELADLLNQEMVENPLLEEQFAGIDPIAVSDIQKIIFHLKARGIVVLITDHNVRETLRITDRAYIVHAGAIFKSGTPDSLPADDEVRRSYLGAEFRLD